MPGATSNNPQRRQRSLANLKRGGNPPAPGNQLARTHGAYARLTEETVNAKVRDLAQALAADAPVATAAHSVAFRLLAETLLRKERVDEFLDRRGFEDDSGNLRPALEVQMRLTSQALDLLREMGMTARSGVALGLDVARGRDLAAEWAAAEGEVAAAAEGEVA